MRIIERRRFLGGIFGPEDGIGGKGIGTQGEDDVIGGMDWTCM